MIKFKYSVWAVALVGSLASSLPAQDFAAKLNAPRVNLISNITNWQNTLQFGRLLQTSSYFKTLIAPQTRHTVFAIENDALAPRFDRSEVNRIVGRRDMQVADQVVGSHILSGVITSALLASRIAAGKGSTTLTTVSGVPLVVTRENGKFIMTGPDGNRGQIVSADHRSRNGIVHVVDALLTQ